MEKELIKEYNRIAESIGAYFCSKYFKSDDFYWVADDRIDGPLYINDMFFSRQDMLNYMRYRYTANQMFKHYYYALDCFSNGDNPICIRDWKKLK
jgi:hypothetical protein